MQKHFTRFVILALVLVGGYFLLTRGNASSYTIPFIEVRTKEITDKIGSAAGKLKQSVTGQTTTAVSALADDFAEAVTEKGEQLVSRVMDGAKTGSFNFFREAVNQKVDSIGANLGIDIQQVGKEIVPPKIESPVVFGIQAGSLAYFTIKNRESEKIKYEADWQDGSKKDGAISVGKSATLSHRWNNPGEYYPKFKIITAAGEKTYEIAISVISL